MEIRENQRPVLQPWTVVASVCLGLALVKNIEFLATFPPFHIPIIAIIHLAVIFIIGNRITLNFWRKSFPPGISNHWLTSRFVFDPLYEGIRDSVVSALVYGLAISLTQATVFFPLMTALFCLTLADSLARNIAIAELMRASGIVLATFGDSYMILIGAYISLRPGARSGMYAVVLTYTITIALFDIWFARATHRRLLNRYYNRGTKTENTPTETLAQLGRYQ